MTPEIRERMDKVRRLMDSPNAGEAEAARIRYAEMQAKYGAEEARSTGPTDFFAILAQHHQRRQQWAEELTKSKGQGDPVADAVERLAAAGYGVLSEAQGLYITPRDDISIILYRHLSPEQLPVIADALRARS